MVDRPFEAVWKFVTDWSNYPKAWPGYEMKQTSLGPLEVGATLQMKGRLELIYIRLAEYEQNRRFSLEYTSGRLKGTTDTSSMEDVEGKTRLTYR